MMLQADCEPSFEEKLAEEARRLSEEAYRLPDGREREELLRRARNAAVASHMTEWLPYVGLPKRR